jgi:hypothetical protein
MNKVIILGFLAMFLSVFAVQAQQKQEGAHEAEYNADSQDREGSGEIDSRIDPSANEDGNRVDAGEQDNVTGTTTPTINITPTDTRTTSSAGSPGVLMEGDETPDGTNTMQRAKPNIAGSPVPGSKQKESGAGSREDLSDNKIFSDKQKDGDKSRMKGDSSGKKK